MHNVKIFLLLVNKKHNKPNQTLNKYSLETLNGKFCHECDNISKYMLPLGKKR